MEGGKIGLLVLRVILIISGAVVLGVAARLAADFNELSRDCRDLNDAGYDCDYNYLNSLLSRPRPSIEYAAFTGAWGLLAALVTLAAVFVSAIPWIVSLAFDGLAAIFYLAGGINNAVQRTDDALFNDNNGTNELRTRWNATTAFMFIGFLCSLGAIALVFFTRRSSGGTRHSAV